MYRSSPCTQKRKYGAYMTAMGLLIGCKMNKVNVSVVSFLAIHVILSVQAEELFLFYTCFCCLTLKVSVASSDALIDQRRESYVPPRSLSVCIWHRYADTEIEPISYSARWGCRTWRLFTYTRLKLLIHTVSPKNRSLACMADKCGDRNALAAHLRLSICLAFAVASFSDVWIWIETYEQD